MNTSLSNRRIAVVGGALLLFAVTLLIHYGRIMLSAGETYDPPGSVLDVERGPILDRNGRLLAIQSELPTVTVWTPYVEDSQATAQQLSRVLNIPREDILQRLSIPNRDVVIKRTITPGEAEVLELLKQQGELPGVTLRRDVGRVYPEGNSASHVIGFTGTDNSGLEGIEFTQDELLSPAPDNPRKRVYGSQIFLTIDIVIQNAVEQIAEDLMEQHSPDSVMIMVMDAKNGDMLSYVSKPDYDLNRFNEFDEDVRRNRPIQMSYEPGSVFKVFSLASFMHLGGVTDSSRFNTSGGYTNPRISIPITDLGNYGVIGPRGIIQYSSNVGAAYASDTVNRESFYHLLRRFGFGQPTGIELNGEESGLLADVERWSGRSKPTIAIGQEIGVTAIQMMQAASALANEGVLLKPHIIKRIVSPSGELIREYGRTPVREVLEPEVADAILEYMNAASGSGGTGRRAAIDGMEISVKTGTAEVIDPETGRYSDELFIASTLAILPSDNPELIMYVVIQHPRGDSFLGGRIAAPVIKDLGEFIIPYLQLDAGGERIPGLPSSLEIAEPLLPPISSQIPDYSGLPLKTLLALYEREDLSLRIHGNGWVQRQTPPPGTPFQEGMELNLYLDDTPPDSGESENE
ncbi:penicillin-binding transpeptidase domain-containing protein [Salinispira pacifica]|uniref:penicillin-binding transpeptidase domain-containing protein n=1 Tax=Salinispira pacifica TaxID=1307761 RepID=UPI00146FA9E3|nr:penicillin-binding transpeptidase domain-containing protein [Salinispira pacifica]